MSYVKKHGAALAVGLVVGLGLGAFSAVGTKLKKLAGVA